MIRNIEKPIERPVKCVFCKKKMYYFDHPKHEEECQIVIEQNYEQIKPTLYAHIRCLPRELYNVKTTL
jgi:hypothetical protein